MFSFLFHKKREFISFQTLILLVLGIVSVFFALSTYMQFEHIKLLSERVSTLEHPAVSDYIKNAKLLQVQILGNITPIKPDDILSPEKNLADHVQTKMTPIGSGFFFSKNLVVTNKHVVLSEFGTYDILTSDGKKIAVHKAYEDPSQDIVFLSGDFSELHLPEIPYTFEARIGDAIISFTQAGVRFGHITDTQITLPQSTAELFASDTPVEFGDSGSLVISTQGEMLGMNTAKDSTKTESYIIPLKTIRESFEKMKASPNATVK